VAVSEGGGEVEGEETYLDYVHKYPEMQVVAPCHPIPPPSSHQFLGLPIIDQYLEHTLSISSARHRKQNCNRGQHLSQIQSTTSRNQKYQTGKLPTSMQKWLFQTFHKIWPFPDFLQNRTEITRAIYLQFARLHCDRN
jgi:hypothetical protein